MNRDWSAILLAAKEEGLFTAEVARRLGVTPQSVSCAARRRGIILRRGRRGVAPITDWPVALRKAQQIGLTLGDVAKLYGCTKPLVHKHTRKYGIMLRGQKPNVGAGLAA